MPSAHSIAIQRHTECAYYYASPRGSIVRIMHRLMAAIGVLCLSHLPCAADEAGFTPLFDGKSLSGWEGNEKTFRVEDGAIVAGSLQERIAHNQFLCTREQFGDFELRLEAKLVGQGKNAGVQFRSERVKDHFEVSGYQCDMGLMQEKPIWGWLYDESRRRKFLAEADADGLAKVAKPDDWNQIVIRCQGPRVQIWVNGFATVDYKEPDDQVARRGIIGLQIHGGEPAEASYRNIRIKKL